MELSNLQTLQKVPSTAITSEEAVAMVQETAKQLVKGHKGQKARSGAPQAGL